MSLSYAENELNEDAAGAQRHAADLLAHAVAILAVTGCAALSAHPAAVTLRVAAGIVLAFALVHLVKTQLG